MTCFCKKPGFYVSNFEIQVLVHQRHIKWKDRKVDPIGSALVPPPSQRCRILFFPWKRYWATHSLLFETCGIFFSGSGKKNTVQKSQIIKVWADEPGWTPTKMTKKWSYELHFRKNTNSHHIIGFFNHEHGYRGFSMRIFFFQKVGSGKKKYRDFHSLTPFLRFPS